MIRRINYKLREWRYNLVDALGFPLRLKGREGEVQIICFHGVCEDHHQLINGRFMHLTRYTELLTSLKRYFHVISYNDFLDGKLHPEKLNILITFDDGYRNFITLALPVLRQLEIPVVLFVNDPEEQVNWPDLFDILTVGLKDGRLVLEKLLPPGAPKSANEWRSWLKLQDTSTVLQFTRDLKQALPEHLRNNYAVFHELLSDEELQEVQLSGWVTLGNHGGNHMRYPSVTEAERKYDLQRVTDRLQRIGCKHPPFAYPYGDNDAISAQNLEAWGYNRQFVAEKASLPQLYTRVGLHPLFSNGNQLRYIHRGYF